MPLKAGLWNLMRGGAIVWITLSQLLLRWHRHDTKIDRVGYTFMLQLPVSDGPCDTWKNCCANVNPVIVIHSTGSFITYLYIFTTTTETQVR